MIVSGMPDTWIGIAPTSTLTDNQKNVYTILSGKGIKLGEGFVTGMAARMFTVAGPVIVFGTAASVVYGVILMILG